METPPPDTGRFGLAPLVVERLGLALGQGLLIHLLILSHSLHVWPATQPAVFAGIFLALLFVPLLVAQAAGQIPWRRAAAWAATATFFAALIGAHSVLRRAPDTTPQNDLTHILPWPPAIAFFAAGVFITQALIVAAAVDRRRVATYSTYFDIAWKQGVQAVAGAAFTAVFWIVLHLGAALFKLIKLDFLSRLIEHGWFAYPATTLTFAAALHVTDVRPQIIRSIKTLMLTLLSWLLPLAAIIAAGFLASLPFTGLAPLWATKAATPILLGCAAGLIILLNASYQDGAPAHAVPRVMRAVAVLAAALLSPLVALAGYGIALRVGQYGWTNDRIIAAAGILVAACYAAGYLWAALSRGRWLHPLQTCNIATSFVAVGVIVALFTPLADPARLAAASQVARLESGAIAPEVFDFDSLRFDNERYGYAAIQRLQSDATGPKSDVIKAAASRTLAMANKNELGHAPVDAKFIADSLTVIPSGSHLPESFLAQDWNAAGGIARPLSECQVHREARCEALLVDLDGDGVNEIVLFGRQPSSPQVFAERSGAWEVIGTLQTQSGCPSVREALREGKFDSVPAAWRDIMVGGVRIAVMPKGSSCTK